MGAGGAVWAWPPPGRHPLCVRDGRRDEPGPVNPGVRLTPYFQIRKKADALTQDGAVPRDFWGRIDQMIDQKVAALARSGMLRNASISGGNGLSVKGGGGITVRDGGNFRVLYREEDGGEAAVYAGDLYNASTGEYVGTGQLIQGPDGQDVAAFRTDDNSDYPVVEIFTADQQIPFATDAVSGQGLSRPFVPAVLHRARFSDWATTTSTSFETLFVGVLYKHHPSLWLQVGASNDTAGATGEIRVLVNDVQWTATQSTQFLIQTKTFGTAPVAGAVMAPLTVKVQARVASGTGGVRVEPAALIGRQA